MSLAVWWLRRVLPVDTNDQLFHTQSGSKRSMHKSLAILCDTGFAFTSTSGENLHSAISLRSTYNHVLNVISESKGCR